MAEEQKEQVGWTQEQTDSLQAKLEMLGTMRLLEKQRNLAKKMGRVSPFSRKNSDKDTEQKEDKGTAGLVGKAKAQRTLFTNSEMDRYRRPGTVQRRLFDGP